MVPKKIQIFFILHFKTISALPSQYILDQKCNLVFKIVSAMKVISLLTLFLRGFQQNSENGGEGGGKTAPLKFG